MIFRKMGLDQGLRNNKEWAGEDLGGQQLDDGDNDLQHIAN